MTDLIPESLSGQPEQDPRRGRVGRIIGNTLKNFWNPFRAPIATYVGVELAQGIQHDDPNKTWISAMLAAGLVYFNAVEGAFQERQRERKLRGLPEESILDFREEEPQKPQKPRKHHSYPVRVLGRMTNPTYWVFEGAGIAAVVDGIRQHDAQTVATGAEILLVTGAVASTVETISGARQLHVRNKNDSAE